MRFLLLESFRRDLKRLKPEHEAAFRAVVLTTFEPACNAWVAATEAGQPYTWPASPRVSRLVGTARIRELTWNFASPDGRATFEFAHDDDGWLCVWRRVGGHEVFSSP